MGQVQIALRDNLSFKSMKMPKSLDSLKYCLFCFCHLNAKSLIFIRFLSISQQCYSHQIVCCIPGKNLDNFSWSVGNRGERYIVAPTHKALHNVGILPSPFHLHWLNQNHLAQIRTGNTDMELYTLNSFHLLEYWQSTILHPTLLTSLNMNLKFQKRF